MESIKRHILVTGAARGIGRAIVDRFRSEGHIVSAPSRSELDLASLGSIEAYIAAHQARRIDVLVNNAGENKVVPIRDLTTALWNRIVMVNLTAPLLLIQFAAKGMVEAGWGRIVNISSVYSFTSRVGRAAYSASKAGLNGLTRTAALELGADGVLVNAVCPGFVQTDLTVANNTPEQIEALTLQIPVGRLAAPAEVAEFVYFLGSDRNTYITGQSLLIDGGFLAR